MKVRCTAPVENGLVATLGADDPTPGETRIDGVPSWAFDRYTRPGRAALGRLILRIAGLVIWAGVFLPRTDGVRAAGELLFRLEGQCLHPYECLYHHECLYPYASGPLSAALRQRWESGCAEMPPDAKAFDMVVLRDAMPELNAIRGQVVAEGVK